MGYMKYYLQFALLLLIVLATCSMGQLLYYLQPYAHYYEDVYVDDGLDFYIKK